MSTSIASMKKPTPPTGTPTKESMALKLALDRTKMSQAAVAKHMGTTPGMVWQWLQGIRPVPANKAEKLARLVSVKPHQISAGFAEVVPEDSNVVPLRAADYGKAPAVRVDLAINRLENDADTLRFALGAMATAMASHRQAEASAVAKILRTSVPAKFLDRGFLPELLDILERAGRGPQE